MTDTDWDEYARRQPHTEAGFVYEPVQRKRAETIVRRAHGRVLDVGGGDGQIAAMMERGGAQVTVVDISPRRCGRARDQQLAAVTADACALPFSDDTFDTVVIAETLEHLDYPGAALKECFRVSADRVVMSVPLYGWADPTHTWRIALDRCIEDNPRQPTNQEQIVLTWERGCCWPRNYYIEDARWKAMFEEGQ